MHYFEKGSSALCILTLHCSYLFVFLTSWESQDKQHAAVKCSSVIQLPWQAEHGKTSPIVNHTSAWGKQRLCHGFVSPREGWPALSEQEQRFQSSQAVLGRAGLAQGAEHICSVLAKPKLARGSVPPYQFCPSSSRSLSVLMPSCLNLSMSLPKYFICFRACCSWQYHPSRLLQNTKLAQPPKTNLCFKHGHTSAEFTGKTLRKAENNECEEHILCSACGHYY